MNKPWSKKAIVYQIYPLSFKDTNDDGRGDLQGIIDKLDYLNDGTTNSLGISAIWLCPIYCSPMADFGYDISDYYDIDPVFGGLETFDRLIVEAHRRKIKIMMDFVPNHTSSLHPWFLESRASLDNPKRNWYVWREPETDGSLPNNWLSVFGGPAWKLDETTGQYYLHSFLEEQPDLNWHNPEVIKEMKKIIKFWVDRGVDGFRLDAIDHLAKDKLLRDDPVNPDYLVGRDDPFDSLLHSFSMSRLESVSTIEDLCQTIPMDRFLVSESRPTIQELPEFYQACKMKMNIPFNFNLINLEWDAGVWRKFIDDYDLAVGPNELPNYVLGNHDRPRIISRVGRQKARLAAMLLLTLRGVPFIYYGDEIGMAGSPLPKNKQLDPWGRQVPGFDLGRDSERTPMQWNAQSNAGFSSVEPWLPAPDSFRKFNVEVESTDPQSFLSLYRQLIHFRNNSAALIQGNYKSLDPQEQDVFAFVREAVGEKLLVLLNFSTFEKRLSLGLGASILVCTTRLDREMGAKGDSKAISLRPYEGLLLTLDNQT